MFDFFNLVLLLAELVLGFFVLFKNHKKLVNQALFC